MIKSRRHESRDMKQNDNLKIRKLERAEHEKTRHLYETVFAEDEKAFVDYYYTWKICDNVIYVAEDEKGIHAMLHLNPFQVSVHGEIRTLHYIVAVATEEDYRHQGLMRELLELAMHEMAEAGEVFTFLMPAAKEIYLPFGFRFAGWQRRGFLKASEEPEDRRGLCESQKGNGDSSGNILAEYGNESVCRAVRTEEYQELADMVNAVLSEQYDVFIWRDVRYYERLAAEQRSQNGDVMVILADGRIVGTFCTSGWEENAETEEDGIGCRMELREIIAQKEYQEKVFGILSSYGNQKGNCRVAGCPEQLPLINETVVPLIMIRELGEMKPADRTDMTVFINEVV